MAIKRSFILSSGIGVSADNLFVVNNTNSVSSTTGSIVLSGGIGIGQSASISGRLQMFNGANYTSFVSSATGNTVYTLPATSPATGSSVLQSTSAGVMSWVPMTAIGGGGAGTVYDGSLNSIPYYPAAGTAITGSSNFTNTGTSINVGYTTAATNSSSGALTVVGGVGIGLSASIAGRLQLFNGANYTAFVSSATGNTVYTLPATSPAIGTSYLTSTSAGILSWTAPSKTNYVLSFGAGFTPTASSADSVSLNIPYTPDGTTKYYYVKRIEYRNETLSGGTGLSFYLERHTSGNASWTIANRITAGSGASFFVGAAVYSSSFTTISSSAGVAASVVSGDYVRLFFTTIGSAANVSIAMTIEEQ